MLALGLWGLDRGTMWRDEGATFQVARRSVPQIIRLLGRVDAVHGLYYLLMHPVLAVRPDEVTLRLPSVLGAAATAALVGALGSRLARPRVGLWAGLLYAGTPFVSHYAQEGRSYALVAAGAALATWLLVRAVEQGSVRGWVAYGAVLAVTSLLHEFAVLLVAAHGVTLLWSRVRWPVWRGWGCAVAAAGVVLAPLVVLSRGQSEQVSWLRRPGAAEAEALVRAFAGPGRPVLAVTLLLAAVAVPAPLPRRGPLGLSAVALPLVVVGPVLLFAVSQRQPLFLDRYLLFCVAGLPLLVAAGAERLLGWLPWRRTVVVAGVLAIGAAFAVQLPGQRSERLPSGRGDQPALVAAQVGRLARPGDAVLFLPHYERRVALFYPHDFRGLRDLTLAASPAASGTLYGRDTGTGELLSRLGRLTPGDRLWVVWDTTTVGGRWFRAQRADFAKWRALNGRCREEASVFVPGGAVSRYRCGQGTVTSPPPPSPR
ncbi:glycosyltransferase family 39 protein [Streptomyces orinoci]|uniref:Glycosyltransferase family 39 protein n=1 Tax=Streptomyces orinoci TaxID=67339 RepID=A0ABV3K5W9_STRON|nr:glycosyltransferase family 39 protein [Streptomyces orinoci]